MSMYISGKMVVAFCKVQKIRTPQLSWVLRLIWESYPQATFSSLKQGAPSLPVSTSSTDFLLWLTAPQRTTCPKNCSPLRLDTGDPCTASYNPILGTTQAPWNSVLLFFQAFHLDETTLLISSNLRKYLPFLHKFSLRSGKQLSSGQYSLQQLEETTEILLLTHQRNRLTREIIPL